MKNGTCPKCNEVRPLTKHHVLPKTHFGHTKEIELICRECHDDLEYFIQVTEGRNRRGRRIKLCRTMYRLLWLQFLTLQS